MSEYLIDLGVRDVVVQAAGSDTPVDGDALRTALRDLNEIEALLSGLERKRRSRLVCSVVAADPAFDTDLLADEEFLRLAVDRITARIEATDPKMAPVSAEISEDAEHGCQRVTIMAKLNGSAQRTIVDRDLLDLPEFQRLRSLFERVSVLGQPPFTIRTGDNPVEVGSLNELHRVIMNGARKGLDVQRYKGLGEMNPEQLWATTMDPGTRTLLQVKVEDAVAAEQMFTQLMGEDVESRRNFIEANALNVRNLDV